MGITSMSDPGFHLRGSPFLWNWKQGARQGVLRKGQQVMKAICRPRSGSKVRYEVLELSPGGCLIDARTSIPKEGESISVWLEGLEALPATVVWAEDGKAGIAFEQLLHEAVYSRLMKGMA
jgi:hypothetical protein